MDPRGKTEVYINDTIGLTVTMPETDNATRMEAAIPLAIKAATWPNNINELIPRKPMIPKDKLMAKGGLSETKVVLGWLFNFRMLTIFLLYHKSSHGWQQFSK